MVKDVCFSRRMSSIRSKNTKPEILVRKYLWSNGFRYRLNHPRLPGKPDIVLRKYSCFWHGHYGCKGFVMPKSNTDFWKKKISRNQVRDKEVQKKLATMGWHSIVIWECELKPTIREKTLTSLVFTLNHIFLEHHKVKRYEIPEETGYAMAAEDVAEYSQ